MFAKNTVRAFTIVELMVAIIVFTLGLLGAYGLISSANSLSLKSKDEIIIGNILREKIELVKNMRDGNWIRSKKWDAIDPNAVSATSSTPQSLEAGYYVIENNFSSPDHPIWIEKLPYSTIGESEIRSELASGNTHMRLCIDAQNRYSHDCLAEGVKKTPFFSFIQIEKASSKTANGIPMDLSGALEVHAYVYAADAGIRPYDMHTLITDWKK